MNENLFHVGQGIDQPNDFQCHVCNGARDMQCNDPFGYFSETGDLVNPDDFISLCNDRHYRDKHGVPDDKTSTMCRKMTQYGNKYIQEILINHSVIKNESCCKIQFSTHIF